MYDAEWGCGDVRAVCKEMNPWPRIRALQRRATAISQANWVAEGKDVREGWRLVASCASPEIAQLVVDMQHWFVRLVNLVLLLGRKDKDSDLQAAESRRENEAAIRRIMEEESGKANQGNEYPDGDGENETRTEDTVVGH